MIFFKNKLETQFKKITEGFATVLNLLL